MKYVRPRTNFHANKGRQRESAGAPLSRDSGHGRSHISIRIAARRRHLCIRWYQYRRQLRPICTTVLFSAIFHADSFYLASHVTQARVAPRKFIARNEKPRRDASSSRPARCLPPRFRITRGRTQPSRSDQPFKPA